ncbi:NAD-dependent epimerase/dehydratase family protein [Subtercola boreus]|uniref:Epimerase n=1 Tax=Subtercola boreus TaxID=120213 RepID=A0A3E0WE93_9MICO|nr:NAD-dependent epimerase/dehydratase family protein [Subtercola boreus]RFA23550.1 epimerase [Subtercola boreus]RFA23944.1 epimerase [Subtercola boreus]RFA29642.1 epimerase [Subtercola boreus]
MRIVVVGATGNLGTATLRRLADAPGVTEIVGVARRTPTQTEPPYSGVQWKSIDIGGPSAVAELTHAFTGADAVVHLGWALQPSHDEPAMWRTNVTGTANVLRAAAAATVGHVLAASSVGAYSTGPKHKRVDESWPTGGLPTSHYARHKAVNERAFDRFERENPDVLLTRFRPGLVFQEGAGHEIKGLFLGRLLPTGWLKFVRPPVIPLPAQMIFQAIHASDVGDAFWRAIDRRAPGAFNIAAEPVLDPQLIAQVLGARRAVPVRLLAAKFVVWLTWRLHLQPTPSGWVDIAANVPIMSTARAREVLGWTPTVSSTDALASIVAGLAHNSRTPGSGPLGG